MVDETDFKFDDKLRQQIHFDWGKFYKRMGKNAHARKQFLDSLSLKENAHGPMEQLSKCYLEKGDALTALDYANQCERNHPKIRRGKYHRNECIYDANEFEKCLVERYRMWNEKKKSLGAVDAIKLTELTLEKSMGHENGAFLNKFQAAISELDKIKSEAIDTRPVWKVRREKGECDVLSISSDNEDSSTLQSAVHPMEVYRSQKNKKKIRTMYYSTSTIETFDFLNNMTTDPRLEFPPSVEGTQIIRNAVDEELAIFKKFELMLRQRQPIYAKKAMRCQRNMKKFNDLALLRMQQTTEYQAKKQLERIQQLKVSDFSKLLTFVEDIMTNFYLIKSEKEFPKKIEFLETIYSIVGVGYIDKIDIPPPETPNNVYVLFNEAFSYSHNFVIPKKFNISPGCTNPNDHFLKRLHYTDIPVEKCYIFHQLSRLYFQQEKYIESKEMGDELIKISTSINNYIWMLLGYLRCCLVDATLGALDSLKVNLQTIEKWKKNVRGDVWKFLEKNLFVVQDEINC